MTRPARVVLGVLGLDQHEVGAIAVSQLLSRHGFEVVYLGRFQTPRSLLQAAESEDADILGISCHSWEFTAYIDELVAGARQTGIGFVVGGSVLTTNDIEDLRARGVAAVFGPGSTEEQLVDTLRELVEEVRLQAS